MTPMMACGKITPINKKVVHRICSGQVVLDSATAVKELVENALDAGATNIEIRLKEYGADMIEVADNGGGITPSDYHAVTQKYHTSKLQEFSDLQELGTFGFRGEALSSLCALSSLSIVTRREEEAVGARLEFDHQGQLKQSIAAARSPGTTVCVKDIFKPLPVRHKEFRRSLKKEYAKMVTVLQAYALISTGVRIICTNQAGNSGRTTVVSTQGASSVRDHVVTVFGSRSVEGLDSFHAPLGEDGAAQAVGLISKANSGMSRATGDRQFLYLNGRPIDLPKVNKLFNETFRSLASHALAHYKPMFVIDLQVPRHTYDVNVTPDKRKVFIQDEAQLLDSLQRALNDAWEPSRSRFQVQEPSSAKQSQLTQPQKKKRKAESSGTASDSDAEEMDEDESEEADVAQAGPATEASQERAARPDAVRMARPSLISGLQDTTGRLAEYRSSPLGEPRRSSSSALGSSLGPKSTSAHKTPSQPLITRYAEALPPAVVRPDASNAEHLSGGVSALQDQQRTPGNALPRRSLEQGLEADRAGESAGLPGVCHEAPLVDESPQVAIEELHSPSPLSGGDDARPSKPGHTSADVLDETMLEEEGGRDRDGGACPLQEDEKVRDQLEAAREVELTERVPSSGLQEPQLTAKFELEKVKERWQRKRQRGEEYHSDLVARPAMHPGETEGQESGESEDQVKAAEAKLERIFEKSSFCDLEILGQFNLGFILARLGNDLFIIDQHASDEKFNFERLTKNTQLNRQPLLAPQRLDLTPSETIIVRENMHIFTQNGFEFKDSDGELMLSGVPYSKNTAFGRADVQELAQLLLDGHGIVQKEVKGSQRAAVGVSEKLPRPTRVRAMLAMRACRSSIMIGKSLDRPAMRQIVSHLADLDSPWNCPHGRPTMRHLAVLPPPV